MPVNPEIASALRDINDRLGDDFESTFAEFEYTPTAAPEPGNDDDSSHRSGALGKILAGAVIAGAVGAAALFLGPTVMSWLESTDQPPALAMVEPAGESTQRVVVDGDTMYLEGMVPDQEVSDVLESAAVAIVGRDRVINNFEVSDEAVYDPDQPIQLSVAEPVLFNTGAATLDEQYRPLIDLAVDLMEAEPTSTLSIIGHTDDVGPDDANLRLSISRAEAVAALVIEHGIDPSRLTVDGRGEAEPLESNETPEGRAVNRRVEFSILGVFGG